MSKQESVRMSEVQRTISSEHFDVNGSALLKNTPSSTLAAIQTSGAESQRRRANSVEELQSRRSALDTTSLDTINSSPSSERSYRTVEPQNLSVEQLQRTNKELEDLYAQLSIENKIKEGAENLLQTFDQSSKGGPDELRQQVEMKLDQANNKISELKKKLEAIRSLPGATRSPARRRRGAGTADPTLPRPQGKRRAQLPVVNTDVEPNFNEAKSPASTLQEYINGLKQIALDDANRFQAILNDLSGIARILKANSGLRQANMEELMPLLMPCLCYSRTEIRAATLRALRHIITDVASIKYMCSFELDFFIVRALARDGSCNTEKEYALKLVRAFADVPDGSSCISKAVMHAIISVAEHTDDLQKGVFLETLSELIIRNAEIVTSSGGMRSLMQTLVEGPIEFSEYLVLCFLHLLDTPKNRTFIRPGTDFEMIIAGFTDAYGRNAASDMRLKDASRILSIMFKQWTGLFYLFMRDRQSIRALVECLRIPTKEIRDILMDLFFDVFSIKPPSWYPTFLAGRRLTVYGRPKSINLDDLEEGQQQPASRPFFPGRPNLLDHYLSLLLLVFVEAGLFDALVQVIESGDENLSSKATLLIGEVLRLCSHLLPRDVDLGVNVQSLPRLFKLASNFEDKTMRLTATAALRRIDNLNRARTRVNPNDGRDIPAVGDGRERSGSMGDEVRRRGQRQVEHVKLKLGINIDDTQFRNLLLESQVLHTKEHTRWNWDALNELVQGPLRNPRRLEEAIKASKFMRRLMSFYRPSSKRFSEIKKTKPNQRYVRLGCDLITTLLHNPEGVRYMSENKLIQQIAHALNEQDPLSGFASSDGLFSKKGIAETLSSGYFTMLGTLSQSLDGVKMMEQHKIFSTFYHLSELRSRDDLIKAIITNLDYSRGGHPRIILSKALTSGYKSVRFFVTRYLGVLMRNPVNKAHEWGIRLLVMQLYDPAMEVCEMAVRVLEEACDDPANLEAIVSLRPSLEHLGEAGNPLLLRFLSTSIGFRYLDELDYIEREMDEWYLKHNLNYVVQVELQMARSNGPNDLWNDEYLEENDSDANMFDGHAPPHFYGELAKTEEGRDLLREKGHFGSFCEQIRKHGLEESDAQVIHSLKAVLWAVGNIGASEAGLPFLQEEGIISEIVKVAETSEILSVRGTSFYILGLIANTNLGISLLEEYGWKGIVTVFGAPTGLAVPDKLDRFLKLPEWKARGTLSDADRETKVSYRFKTAMEKEIVQNLADLSNHILANSASKNLTKLKLRHRDAFSSVHTYRNALKLLENYSYRLPVRRFILELFDVPLDMSTYEVLKKMSVDEAARDARKASHSSTVKMSAAGEGGQMMETTRISSNTNNSSINNLSVLTPLSSTPSSHGQSIQSAVISEGEKQEMLLDIPKADEDGGRGMRHRLSTVFDDESPDDEYYGKSGLNEPRALEYLSPQNIVRGFVI